MKITLTCAILLGAAAPVAAQEFVYVDTQTESCLIDMVTATGKLDCVGQSADACIDASVGGETTIGMGGCLDEERKFWDARLNATYRQLIAQHGDNAILTDRLRDMQRIWITYRDARCDYELVQWGGGTGGGPALIACLMKATAEQTLILEQNIR